MRRQDTVQDVFIKACERGEENLVIELIKNKYVNVNMPDGYGEMPLVIAAKRGKPEIVKILLRNGADIEVVCNEKGNIENYIYNYDVKSVLNEYIDHMKEKDDVRLYKDNEDLRKRVSELEKKLKNLKDAYQKIDV